MIIIMVDLLLANKILYSTKLKKCKADYSSRLYQSLFPKKDKFSLPAVKLALTSTFMNWFICLSTTTTVNIGHEAVAIRSKLDLGFRCNETLICYWASSLIDAKFFVFCRTVFSPKTFLILPFMFTGRVHWEFTAAIAAANVGTSLSMALSVLLLCRLTELSTWRRAVIKISIASAILRGTAITSIKERYAWDSGSATALHMETLMATQDGIQYPVYLLKKFLKLKLKSDFRLKWLMRSWVIMSSYTTKSKNR